MWNKTLSSFSIYSLQNKCTLYHVIKRKYNDLQNVVQQAKHIDSLSNCETKLLKVAIIGVPNAGKSTLINHLVDRRVCPASNKVHTTRKRTHAITTDGRTQIIFLDTPGIVSNAEFKRYNLEKSFRKDCTRSLNEADIIGVIHDVSNTWTRERLDIKIINLLEQNRRRASFLVLNKIDVLKSKRKLLDWTKMLTEGCINSVPYETIKKQTNHDRDRVRGWPHFSQVFMVSALNGDGVQDIRSFLANQAKPGKWLYPETQWSDHSPDDIIVRTVQATLLDFLPQEIPYKLQTEMELFETLDNGSISAVVLIHCPVPRIQKLVVGVGDGKLRQITEKAQKDLLRAFDQPVRLRIVVKSDKLE